MQSLSAPTQHCKGKKKAHILYHIVFEGGERTEAPNDCQIAHETLSRIFMTLFSQKRKGKEKNGGGSLPRTVTDNNHTCESELQQKHLGTRMMT